MQLLFFTTALLLTILVLYSKIKLNATVDFN